MLGRLGRRAIAADDDRTVEEAMTEGPVTIRPSAAAADVLERMREHDVGSYPVTTSDGRLVGLVLREDAEAAVGGGRR